MSEDPRKGMPSASALERIALCPGSLRAAEGLPDDASESASFGTNVHAILESKARNEWLAETVTDHRSFTEEEAEAAEDLWGKVNFVIREWLAGREIAYVQVETRLWGNALGFSGMPDLVIHAEGGDVLILDYKSLFGDQPETGANMQLQALAYLVALDTYKVNNDWRGDIYAGIIQRGLPAELVKYQGHGIGGVITEAGVVIGRILKAAKTDSSPRIPGPVQCKYCRARFTCPDATGKLAEVNESIVPQWHELTPQDKRRLAETCKLVGKLAADIEAKLKEELTENPDSIPGLKLKPGNTVREIKDALATWDRIGNEMTPEEFVSGMTVKIGKLEDTFYRKRKAVNPKVTKMEARREFELALSGLIEERTNRPSLMID